MEHHPRAGGHARHGANVPKEVQDLIESRLRAIVAGVASTFDMGATVRYERRYPATVNTAEETGHAVRAMQAVVGDAQVDTDPVPEMGSEDFAFMLRSEARLLRVEFSTTASTPLVEIEGIDMWKPTAW